MAAVFEIEGLTKTYKGASTSANDQLTFEIHEGEFFGLLGPNGAGKSTLVNQLAGLVKPTSGNIRLYGIDVVKRPDLIAHYVSLQPQQDTALWDLFPEEWIYHTGRFRDLPAREARIHTDQIMDELGLNSMRKRQIRRLSGGQQRLVALAVALIGNRPVQIFDEPTNQLDPEIRRLVWQKLQERNRQGTTVILVTHNVLEAERVIQRVGIINHGRMMAIGRLGELKERIDQRVRLELLFKEDAAPYVDLLGTIGAPTALGSHLWTVLCDRETARGSIDQVMGQIGLDHLDDFRILTPSLEDVYLQLGGGERLD
jgi:ABC-2 type transport system ATP-binding protein